MSPTAVRGPDPSRFLSGSSGDPGGRAKRLALRLADRVLDAQVARAAYRLDELAAAAPERGVLVLSVYRGDDSILPAAVDELRDSRHRVRFALGAMHERATPLAEHTTAEQLTGGKFENLNHLLERYETARGSDPLGGRGAAESGGNVGDRGSLRERYEWVLVVDDDVALPRRFLDRLVGVAEHFGLAMAQPAQTLASHAAWPVTRRRRGALLRESRFVEIGPVTLLRRDTLEVLAPFPPLRYGWGLDLHWAAVAEERGWRLGIVDALAVRHESGRVAGSYSSQEAIEEARAFLAERPFLDSAAVQETKRVHPLR